MPFQRTSGALLLLVLLACGGRETRAPDTQSDSATMTVPAGSAGQLSAMPMLPAFRAHLDSVAAQPAMLKSTMSEHQTEVRAVVDAMRADMTGSGMHSDAAYEALADSVVAGSAAIGKATGGEFTRLVEKHLDQTRRLASVYETKVAAM
ncbi:MAG: hypothetical protein ABIY46_15540 [Gemmatimonadales bacterium]